jgi:hypothetical protein
MARTLERLAGWEVSDCKESGEGRGFRYVHDLLKGARTTPHESQQAILDDRARLIEKRAATEKQTGKEDEKGLQAVTDREHDFVAYPARNLGELLFKIETLETWWGFDAPGAETYCSLDGYAFAYVRQDLEGLAASVPVNKGPDDLSEFQRLYKALWDGRERNANASKNLSEAEKEHVRFAAAAVRKDLADFDAVAIAGEALPQNDNGGKAAA